MAALVPFLVLFAAAALSPVARCPSTTTSGSSHVDARGTTYTKLQLLNRVVADPITSAPIVVRASQGEYLVDLAMGTPPVEYTAIMDTDSDLFWTQCAPCMLCSDQPTPFFQPARSATYRLVRCGSPRCAELPYPTCFHGVCVYQYYYGDYASSAGETFTFGAANSTKVSVPGVAFGCGNINTGDLANSSGMVGLGRGPLSLDSQLCWLFNCRSKQHRSYTYVQS